MKSSEHVTLTDTEAVKKLLKAATSSQKRGTYTWNILSGIRAEVGKYALCYGTTAAGKSFSSKYRQYEFKRSTVNNWKKNYKRSGVERRGQFTKVA